MALPTLDATFASSADLPRKQMLAKWLVEELDSGSIADYYDLPERYLWAKIAVAAGGPKTEADYISLPTRHVWSDIYNAVAGSSGNHTDWSERLALGHIAAAYRGDTASPEALATYINWPWRYQVASIITSLLASPLPACDNAIAQVLMTGWVFGDRTLSPIGYFPYGKETYQYGDESVRYEDGVWIYENSGLGEITRAYSYADYPWLATWDSPFTSSKICP